MNLSCQMRPGNRNGWPTWGLDPPPLGQRECVEFPSMCIYTQSKIILTQDPPQCFVFVVGMDCGIL